VIENRSFFRYSRLLGVILFSGSLTLEQRCRAANPADVSLYLMVGNDNRTITLKDLKKILPGSTLNVYNALYKRDMAYEGFWLDDLIRKLKLRINKESQLVFICRDGYTSVLPMAKVGKHKWLLAYGEASGHWTELVHDGQTVSPTPWYLVGSKKESFGEFPWPYQIVGIRSLSDW